MNLRRLLLAIFLAAFAVGAAPAHAETNVLFIFDSSGSMKKKVDSGEQRMTVAKRAMAQALEDMPADVRVGLLLYGHRKAKDCTDIELKSPIGADDAATIAGTIEGLKPKGETPIAAALEQAIRSFAALKGQANRVVLVTEVSLAAGAGALQALAPTLDAVLLPGSSNDVDPQWYHTARHEKCGEPDAYREQADFSLLDHAWSQRKPVLAICYGLQSLNVWRSGHLIQDIGSQVETPLTHEWRDRASGNPEPHHPIQIVADSELGRLAQPASEVTVNSSHHQSVKRAGRDLRVTAHAPDGVVEALEHVADGRWVVAVQWHPERAPGDPLTQALFSAFVGVARRRVAA